MDKAEYYKDVLDKIARYLRSQADFGLCMESIIENELQINNTLPAEFYSKIIISTSNAIRVIVNDDEEHEFYELALKEFKKLI